ncbi:MAG: hypothetical protein HC848_04315 [Limnobacter sp.]|nr:hypothetical protein [Limnobacter sp.]
MPVIKIDNIEYDTDALSENARNQVINLQVVDQKIHALHQELAIMQTARAAYSNALRVALSEKPV